MPKKNYKKEIIESAKRELVEKGYHNMNMRSIAKGAGIKAPSIYNHFRTKDEIIYYLILEGRLKLSKMIKEAIKKEDKPEKKISVFFDSFIKFGFENRGYYNIIFMQSYPFESMIKVKDDIAREIEPGLKTLTQLVSKYIQTDMEESMVIAETFFHMVHGHISLSILNRSDFLFNIPETQKRMKRIIIEHLDNVKNTQN